MRPETSLWLGPMVAEAERRHVDVEDLLAVATAPAVNHLGGRDAPGDATGLDWVRFGRLLRERLGWTDTYPAVPDFPEIRDTD